MFHNLRGYDSHLILKEAYNIAELGDFGKDNKPNFKLIPSSYGKFMSFEIGHLRFIDSSQFLASSLDTLVENLKR